MWVPSEVVQGDCRDLGTKVSRVIFKTRFRGKSARMISGKEAQYKLFWIKNEKDLGGLDVFLAEKWVDKVIDISRIMDRMTLFKILLQRILILVISVHAPSCGLNVC